jgi:dUTP pyrophosphatase
VTLDTGYFLSSIQQPVSSTQHPVSRTMDNTPTIKFVRLKPDLDADIPLPRYMTPRAAGMDICAAVEKDFVLKKGAIELIPTGFAVAIPAGYEAQIRPRSGLAVKHGIGLINSPGTIDADYRGEVKIAVINLGKKDYTFSRGDRIAQMVINRVYPARLEVVQQLDKTDRNTGGFGHTGS